MPHERGRREESGGGRHVERPSSELIGLLRRTHALMESGELAKDVDTVASIYDGVAGHEAKCARHTFCSRALETLVRVGSDAQRRGFYSALLDALELEQLLIDRYASHLIDLLCTLAAGPAPAAAPDSGEDGCPSLAELVVRVSDTLVKDDVGRRAVCYDRYGSHVMQTLLATLSGEPSAKAASTPWDGEANNGGPRKPPPAPTAAESKARPVPPAFREALLRLVAALAAPDSPADAAGQDVPRKKERKRGRGREGEGAGAGAAPSALIEMASHSCASMVVQAALHALRSQPAALVPLAEQLLNWAGACQGSIPPAGTPAALRDLACTVGGARTLEALISVGPPELLPQLYGQGLRGHALALSLDRSANFVVQRLLENVSSRLGADQSRPLLGLLVGELEGAGAELLAAGRAGVLWKLVEACARAQTKEKEAFRAVLAMLSPAGNQTATLAHALLALRPGLAEADLAGTQPSALGARLAQACLLLPPAACQPLVASFHRMPPALFAAVACDAAGSRVVEALFSAPGCPPAARAPLAKKLRGEVAKLARDRCGSHALERCFGAVDVDGKRSILDELLASEASLASSAHAALVCKKLRLHDYKRRQREWVDEETANQKKRRMFADLLTPDAPLPAAQSGAEGGAAADVAAAAKSLGGRALDAIVSTLGYENEGGAVRGAQADGPGRADAAVADKAGGAVTGFDFLGSVLGATGSDRQQRKKRKREREQREKEAAAAAGAAAGGEDGEGAGQKKAGKKVKDPAGKAKKFSMS